MAVPQLLLTPEDLDLNLAISQYFKNINLMLALKMTKIKKKKPGVAHCLKASFLKKFKFKFDCLVQQNYFEKERESKMFDQKDKQTLQNIFNDSPLH